MRRQELLNEQKEKRAALPEDEEEEEEEDIEEMLMAEFDVSLTNNFKCLTNFRINCKVHIF